MPATSKSQQRLMGMVHAYQKGALPNAPTKIQQVARHISSTDAKHFAETKHDGLPEHVKLSSLLDYARALRYSNQPQAFYNATSSGSRKAGTSLLTTNAVGNAVDENDPIAVLRLFAQNGQDYSTRLKLHQTASKHSKPAGEEWSPGAAQTILENHFSDLPIAQIKKAETEFEMGIKEEVEHGPSMTMRKRVAKDHLREDPHYYTKLERCMNKKSNCAERGKNIPASFDDRQKPFSGKAKSKFSPKTAFVIGFTKAATDAGLTEGEAVDLFNKVAAPSAIGSMFYGQPRAEKLQY